MIEARPWHLAADLGGTRARFAAATAGTAAPALVHAIDVSACTDFDEALDAFLAVVTADGGWQPMPRAACLAVAAPVHERVVRLTNAPWSIDRDACAARLGLDAIELINDFAAIGHAVAHLGPDDWSAIGSGNAAAGEPQLVLGPGTGLGVCTVLPGKTPRVIAGEGGHVDLPAVTGDEISLMRALQGRFGRVSAERALSGPGLVNIHSWVVSVTGTAAAPLQDPAAITRAAARGEPAAGRALELFCAMLGAFAGNAALTVGARGGVYLAGGIAPGIFDFLAASSFRERFAAKGRYRGYLEAIPTRVIVRQDPGLLGALRYLQLVTESRAGARWDDRAPPCDR